MRHRRFVLPIVLVLGLLAGCDSAATPGPLPRAAELAAKSARSLRALDSVQFRFSVNGTIPGFPVRSAGGVARTSGWAKGTVDLQHGLGHTEYQFTLNGGTVRLTGGDGPPSTRPVPQEFTPADLLNSDSGIRLLLRRATSLRTETTETMHGTPTFRVTGKLDKATLSAIVPGVWADAVVKFWIGKAPQHALHRIWVQLPPRQPNAGVVALQLALSKHNAVTKPSSSVSTSSGPSRQPSGSPG